MRLGKKRVPWYNGLMYIAKIGIILTIAVVGIGPATSATAGGLEPAKKQTLTTPQLEPVIFSEVPEVEYITPVVEVVAEVPTVEVIPLTASFLQDAFLQAALSQVGLGQDCTDLVQNALAAVGLTSRRDSGGFDYGVTDVAFTFATQIDPSQAMPGDIATTGPNNGGHVWVILDPVTNHGVHGGWGGTTVIGDGGVPIAAHAVYRLNG
jgi:hypothetical protein